MDGAIPEGGAAVTGTLHRLARSLGAAGTGVCTAEPFPDSADRLREMAASGRSAGMAFTYRDPEIATDVRRTHPWAERLFVVAHPYLPDAGTPRPEPGQGRVARFATRNHYDGLDRVLGAVAAELGRAGFRAEPMRDDHRLVDRAAAVRAGVGWWGKNTMVLMPGIGPWVLLGSVVTDAPLQVDVPMTRTCGTCAACLPACPTGALVEPGMLDANLCLAYWLQAPGVIPRELRAAVGDRVYGCDDCLEACPPGGRLLEATPPRDGVDLVRLLALDDAAVIEEHRHFYIPDRRARYLRRNALVALGNTAPLRGFDTLAGYAGHHDWLLRVHAVWALGRLGGDSVVAVLRAVAEEENDPRVIDEIDVQLGAPGSTDEGAGRV